MLASPCMLSWGTFQLIFLTENKLNKIKLVACVSPGSKKLGDFTVSEGHGHPLISYINLK
jgi:hypothetical protein